MISRLSSRNIALLVIGATVLVAFGWYFSLYSPAVAANEVLRGEIGELETKKQLGQAAQRNIGQLCGAVAALEVKRAEFLQALPPTEELAGLLGSLRERAVANGSRINSFSRNRTLAPGLPAGVKTVNIALGLDGAYQSLIGTLRSIEALQRFTKIETVGFTVGRTPETFDPRLDSKVALTAYIYDDPKRGVADAVPAISPLCQTVSVAPVGAAGGRR